MSYPLRLLVCCALTASTWCARPESIRSLQKDSELSVSLSLPPYEDELAPEDEIEVGSDAVGSVAEVPNTPKSWTYSWISSVDPQKKDRLKCSRGKSPLGPVRCRKVLRNVIGDKTKYIMEVIKRTDSRAEEFPPGCSLKGETMYFNKLGNSTATRDDVRLVCSFTMKQDVRDMTKLVNQERLRTWGTEFDLCPSIRATTAAFKHSQDMALRDYFDHTAPDPAPNGQHHCDRLLAEGFRYAACGENIAAGRSSLDQTFQAWNASSGHRYNMMYTGFTHLGFAYYEQRTWPQHNYYRKYWTQVFGRVKDPNSDDEECD